MNRLLMYVTVVGVLILSGISLYLVAVRPERIDYQYIPVSFLVADSIGFDLNSTALTFGKVTPGGSSSRIVTIANDRSYPVQIILRVSSNIAPYLIVPQQVYVIDPYATIEIPFSIRVNSTIPFGWYTGGIEFETYSLE